ncbi:MAG: hypothetical protein N4A35_11730 [Flavobacteriales bacterium]|jgi:hypothetical protein|nr:hypothetical protein [Flavobacteriales bacterium]
MFTYRFIITLLIALLFIGCKKKDVPATINFHYNYIPTELGQWNEYKVTEISHSTTGAHDTTQYFLKEIITEQLDATTYRLERYWRTSTTENWEIKDVWTSKKTASAYQQTEENVKYTKLIFPVKGGQIWNGNAYNSEAELSYKYDSIHNPYSINNINFDSTVIVVQQDNVNAIEYQKAKEVYAKDVGLIYKSDKDLSINFFDVTDINEGTELEMKLINHGQ